MKNHVCLPPFPIKGGCQCGAVRYELTGPPLVFYLCHCTECQKQSSSAFGLSMRVRHKDLAISGQLNTYSRPGTLSDRLDCEFCPICGTRLFHRRSDYADNLNIKAGSLDEPGWLKPAGHIWTKSKQGWFEILPGELSYQGQPATLDGLVERWRQMTGTG